MTSHVEPNAISGRRVAARLAAKAGPNLVIAAVVPSVCFLVGRSLWGLPGAIALALLWNASCQGVRRLAGKPLSGLLILGSVELVVRALVALLLNSARMYFIAPAIVTAVTGLVCVASAFTSRPLLAPVIADLVPSSVFDVRDPRHTRLLQKGSAIYGLEQVLTAAVSMVMIANTSMTVYAAVHPLVSWLVLGLVVSAVIPTFRSDWRGARLQGAVAAA
jgi:hypothetical protein